MSIFEGGGCCGWLHFVWWWGWLGCVAVAVAGSGNGGVAVARGVSGAGSIFVWGGARWGGFGF